MNRRRSKQKELGQNFLRDKWLAERLVRLSSIVPGDVVYEIGPGCGRLTEALASTRAFVTAVEFDPALARQLRYRFRGQENVRIVESDFLRYRVKERHGYKIFASVPYGITARVLRKIFYEESSRASEVYLIIQRECAEKYSGLGRRGETLRSVLAKVHFEFEVLYRLRREDFEPVPKVESVLLRMIRRSAPLLTGPEHSRFEAFVRHGFCTWRKTLRLAMKHEFSYKRWKRLARELDFDLDAKPSEVKFEQWLALFRARSSLR